MQSIERAFVLLRALAVGPAGVTELAERCDLPKSTVARLLSALEEQSAVEQDEVGGEYRLGQSLADLAGAAAPGRNLVTAARPHLWQLTEATGETSGLSVADGNEVLYLDHFDSDEEVQVRDWTGERVPMHLVPSGLIMLADMGDQELEQYLNHPLLATTESSMTDPAAIRSRLKQSQADGYVWVYAEFDESINSVAAPVTDASGATVAALHVHGPAYRFPDKADADEIAHFVRDAAERLSQQLTY